MDGLKIGEKERVRSCENAEKNRDDSMRKVRG